MLPNIAIRVSRKKKATLEPSGAIYSPRLPSQIRYLSIAVGTPVTRCPPHRPGLALISASGSSLRGTLRRAEIVRYDLHNHEFVPYLHGVSAEGLSFSRDARWVTYISYPDGTLWRSKIDGSDRLQLTFPPLQVTLPRWSPDGRQIAFLAQLPG